MSIEVRTETTALAYQIEEARALAAGSLLPDTYRNQPANVLIAMNLGAAMGLSPAESLYRIAVIKGKPTASAELIASNVRKAGHRLRVVTDEKATSATATIVRADDPEFEFAITRDMAWAKSMNLATNDNYRKQPLTMLANRAITACARLACPETLYGVAYTADEMSDMAAEPRRGIAQVLNIDPSSAPEPVATEPEPDAGQQASAGEDPDIHDAEVVEPKPLTKRTQGRLFALFAQKGVGEDQQLPGINHILGTVYESRSQLTEDDARKVIAVLETRPDAGAES